ncbi:MAG: hypothetical protein P8179_23430, partial [Candidatus Thiodiazotropha sp.]
EQGRPLPDPDKYAIRLSLYDYEDDFNDYFSDFLKLEGIANIDTLLLGVWTEPWLNTPDEAIKQLIDHRASLPKLSALFIGDIDEEDCMVSFMQQTNLSAIYEAFPALQTLKTRGTQGLSLGRLQLPQLHTLIMVSQSLDVDILDQISAAEIPQLSHLELWLGGSGHGYYHVITPEQLANFLTELHKFPKLTSLGLCNYEGSDELARVISETGLPPSVTRLDLSNGNLTDEGGRYLLEAAEMLKQLQSLDLNYHYLSDEMMERFSKLPLQVDVSSQVEVDENDSEVFRYIGLFE